MLCFQVWRWGGGFALEHPRDRGHAPYPSIFVTPLIKWLELTTEASQIHFSQCRLGAPSKKDTTLLTTITSLGYLSGPEYQCCHEVHQSVLKGKTKKGTFRSSKAAQYPPELCKALAKGLFQEAPSWPQTTLLVTKRGDLRPPPGLEGTRPRDPEYLTKSGRPREPDYVVGDRLCYWNWKEIFKLKTGDTDKTHINFKEMRALRMWVRREARSGPSTLGRRIITLCDSRVCVGAVGRGRSASINLNRTLKQTLPLLLGSKLYLTVLWVPTGANPSDAPSRDFPLPQWLREARRSARGRKAAGPSRRRAEGQKQLLPEVPQSTQLLFSEIDALDR
jgi:hypothetical protein